MHFYSQNYPAVMALPIKAFWLMNTNIDRIQAQKDMRSLSVSMSAQSSEAAKDMRQRLIVEAGTIVKVEGDDLKKGRPYVHEERDEVGFAELKGLSLMI